MNDSYINSGVNELRRLAMGVVVSAGYEMDDSEIEGQFTKCDDGLVGTHSSQDAIWHGKVLYKHVHDPAMVIFIADTGESVLTMESMITPDANMGDIQ